MEKRTMSVTMISQRIKRYLKLIQLIALVGFCLISLSGCASEYFTINFKIEAENVHAIEYRNYHDGEPYSQGRIREKDDSDLIVGKEYKINFSNNELGTIDEKVLATFQLEVFLVDDYGNEQANSELLALPAEYGKTYKVIVGGNSESGLTLELVE